MSVGIKPSFSVVADGTDITAAVAQRLVFLRVLDCRQFENSRFEIQIDNRPPYVALPEIGSQIIINMGYDGNVRNMGSYEVDEVVIYGAAHTMTIIGHAKGNQSDFKATQNRSWHNQTLQDVVSTLATANGLVPNIVGSIGSQKIDHLDQTSQSDMGFLTDLARNYNATFKVMNGTLYFAQNGQTQGDSLSIDMTEETHYQYTYQTRGFYPGGVIARYSDKASGKEMIATSGSGQGGQRALTETFQDKTTAQGAADSLNASMAGSADTFNVKLPGNPLLMSAQTLIYTGLPPQIPTSWIADRVEHLIQGTKSYETMVDNVSPATSSANTGQPGEGNQNPAPPSPGGSQEKEDNKDQGNDGHTVTEEVDGNGNIST